MSWSDTMPVRETSPSRLHISAEVGSADRTRPRRSELTFREATMAEQPLNLATTIYLGVFSRAEQRVLQAIFRAIDEGNGRCVATLAILARDSKTSRST